MSGHPPQGFSPEQLRDGIAQELGLFSLGLSELPNGKSDDFVLVVEIGKVHPQTCRIWDQ